MNLTTLELEIVKHRLGVPDAIAECLESEGFAYDEVEARAYELAEDFTQYDPDSKLDRAILVDCCDGCTYFGNSEYWSSARYKRARFAAAKTLGEKVGAGVAIW